jgi:hypothetical protein
VSSPEWESEEEEDLEGDNMADKQSKGKVLFFLGDKKGPVCLQFLLSFGLLAPSDEILMFTHCLCLLYARLQ